MKLRQQARVLKQKALTSFITAAEAFNSPRDDGRVTKVLLHLQHSFEMLLKAALVQARKPVFDETTGRSIGFERCIGLAMSDGTIKLSEADAGTLRAIDAMRDDEQHWFNEVSEQILYLHVRAAVMLFDDILHRVFGERLSTVLPERVLPVSADPPKDLALLLDDEYTQIRPLLRPGRRDGHEARTRIRTLLAMEAHVEPDTRVSERDVDRVEKGIRNGDPRDKVFPRLSDVATTVDGEGLTITVHFTRKDGAPVRYAADDSTPAAAIRQIDLQNKRHKIERTKVHRLDAVDAYNQKLVKKIAVRGITVKYLAGSTAYLYVDGLEVGKGADFPKARVELEVQTAQGIKRQVKRLSQGMNLHDISGGIEAYKGLFIRDVDANRDIIELSNGDILGAGEVTEDVAEDQKRRIQIREVIRAHLDKERELFAQGIKTLSLFFIDEVAKYRDYDREDTLGEYARVFEEEYAAELADYLGQLDLDEAAERYRKHVEAIPVRKTHEGYFSIDKKTGRSIDGSVKKTGETAGQSDDVDAYDLILKDKERLLSFEEPVRFIWSHSALREGWDNPNVFVMGMLKKSDNTTTRRQEIGRGLRLSVDQHGERMDNPVTVHDINELSVVTDESYTEFVIALQKEIVESLSARPRKASVDYFTGKQFKTADGSTSVLEKTVAQALYNHLIRNNYIDDDGLVTQEYKDARADGTLAAPTADALKTVIDFVWPLVDALYLDVPKPTDGRKPKKIPFNEANFKRREFQELWGRINHKAVYQVEFDSAELIANCIRVLDKSLNVTVMQYLVERGKQVVGLEVEQLEAGTGFKVSETKVEHSALSAGSTVKYDLLGEIAEKTQLTRRTCAAILTSINPGTFAKFKQNPEQFITEAARLINEQKAAVIVEHLIYDPLDNRYDSSIFTENQTAQDLSKTGDKLKKSVYEYVVTDSKVERSFVEQLDVSDEVVVYSKLPRGFFIPTPVGDYNPDWAIAFRDDTTKIKHVYFVAETKGSLSTLELRGVEEAKIDCARKFFAALNEKLGHGVKYDVVTDYTELMQIVAG